MTLTFCWDLSAADWIAHSDLRWSQLVGFGAAGFDAYARLRFLPDPACPAQSENDVVGQDWRADQLPRLFEVLATHTATPDDLLLLRLGRLRRLRRPRRGICR